jgi:hypothetical protein
MLILIMFLIIAEAKQISDQRRSIQLYKERAEVAAAPIEAAIEPPRKPYSFKATVLELIKATPYPANETDTDKDGLPDSVEWVIGTDFNNSDTDFDNLNDTYEVFKRLGSLRAGFKSKNTFHRLFQELVEMTPMEYRGFSKFQKPENRTPRSTEHPRK